MRNLTVQTGDILASTTRPGRHIIVGHPHPTEPRIWCHPCTPEGTLQGTGSYLLPATLATRYELARRAVQA